MVLEILVWFQRVCSLIQTGSYQKGYFISRFQESGDVATCALHLTVTFSVKRKSKRSTQVWSPLEIDPTRVLVGSKKGRHSL